LKILKGYSGSAYLPDFLVGTGGWAYFKVPNKPSLKAYSELFNFVEVNYTFYEYPTIQAVQGWRKTVPKNFTFSVRCHQDLTHNIGFVPTSQAYEIFYQMRSYCNTLSSPYLVLETPAKYEINQENAKDAWDFFFSLNLDGLRLVWEYRAPMTQTVIDLMQNFRIIPCIDLSMQSSNYNLDVTYSRLFGKGQHNIYQFTDDELAEIDQKAQETNSKTVILSYHGTRMNTDAARFLHYKSTGKFLPATAHTGFDSAKAVLAEDATFPATKTELKAEQGWKVIDVTPEKRVHLSEVLNKIPDKTYSNLEEIIKELRMLF
jgi:uncharacterized protein YecE (DUF72 family)